MLVGGVAWRGGAGGGGVAGCGEARDARAPVGGVRGVVCVVRVVCVRAAGGGGRAARAAGGRAHRLLRGHRRTALGRRRGAGVQPHARRPVSHVPGRRLPAASAQHHAAAAVHRAARR